MINEKRVRGVLERPGPIRYSHFVKRAADSELVWSLYEDGWVALGDGSGASLFPIWADADFASICAAQEWRDAQPRSIPLQEFMAVFLPNFKEERTLVAVMMTLDKQGVVVEADQLQTDVTAELERYD